MAIKVNGTTVIDDSRNLVNVIGLKTINSTSILGSGDISAGGLQTIISTTVVSVAAATVDISWSNTGYSQIRIEFDNLKPSNDNVRPYVRMSDNAGSTFFTSSGNYHYVAQQVSSVNTVSHGGFSASHISLVGGSSFYQGNNIREGLHGSLSLHNPTDTTNVSPAGAFNVTYSESAGRTINSVGGFKLPNVALTTDIDAIRIFYSTGNVASGTIRVIGIA